MIIIEISQRNFILDNMFLILYFSNTILCRNSLVLLEVLWWYDIFMWMQVCNHLKYSKCTWCRYISSNQVWTGLVTKDTTIERVSNLFNGFKCENVNGILMNKNSKFTSLNISLRCRMSANLLKFGIFPICNVLVDTQKFS